MDVDVWAKLLPAMDAERSNVAAAVGYFWNQWASLNDNVVLIICGSATSWMIVNVINSKGGLHDRITIEHPIHPFSLKETEEYIESQGFVWNRQMILLAYMVFGGIPYYLSLLDKGESAVQNIDRLFLVAICKCVVSFDGCLIRFTKIPDVISN